VTAVLPAEYGVDPLGTGKALGLLALYDADVEEAPPPPPAAAVARPRIYNVSSVELALQGRQGVEFKYRLEKDAVMVYAWKTSRPMKYEFHGDPEDPTLKVESYEKRESDVASGSFTAPFSGIHGWFWENPGSDAVTITITSAGFFSEAIELRPKFDLVKKKNYLDHILHDISEPLSSPPASRSGG
jgi:hypothetical protein